MGDHIVQRSDNKRISQVINVAVYEMLVCAEYKNSEIKTAREGLTYKKETRLNSNLYWNMME